MMVLEVAIVRSASPARKDYLCDKMRTAPSSSHSSSWTRPPWSSDDPRRRVGRV